MISYTVVSFHQTFTLSMLLFLKLLLSERFLNYFSSSVCTAFYGCVLERLLFTPRFLISGYFLKKT